MSVEHRLVFLTKNLYAAKQMFTKAKARCISAAQVIIESKIKVGIVKKAQNSRKASHL